MTNFLGGINSSISALEAQRVRMEVIAQNIANANTTHGPDGKPYQRQQVLFESVLNSETGVTGLGAQEIRIAHIEQDKRPPKQVYNPGHPDANPQGMVSLPDINIHEEMADLIASSRSFEANLAVIKNARSMAMQTLSIAKH